MDLSTEKQSFSAAGPIMYPRILQLTEIIKRKSFFLLGPRQVGKSTLLRTTFPQALYINLLQAEVFRELCANPETMRQKLDKNQKLIIIDEIQKLPELLDEVQLLLDLDKDLRIILTGSSARKLKRGKANLLGGRAYMINMHPLISAEFPIDTDRTLDRINRGSMPGIIDSNFYDQDLDAYVGTYLREEIQAEGLTRSLGSFNRALEIASLSCGQQINYTQIGNDAQVPPRTVQDFFQIFSDTMIGETLPVFSKTIKRKSVSIPKFYLFDLGVARVLRRRSLIIPKSIEYGEALEHLVYLELRAYIHYHFKNTQLTYWRSKTKLEVDFVIDDKIAIEVKATGRVSENDLKGIKAFSEEITLANKMVICSEKDQRIIDDIVVIPFELFFKKLWEKAYF